MNRNELLVNTYSRIDELVNNTPAFRNNIAQVRTKAMQEELASKQAEFSFDPKNIWKYCDYIFSESCLLLREDHGESKSLLESVALAGENFEFIARFHGGREREILLINSAICYHIAGYQANAYCISKLLEREFGVDYDTLKSEGSCADDKLSAIFRTSLLRFLQRDIKSILTTSKKVKGMIDKLQDEVASSMDIPGIYNLIGHAYFQRFLIGFSNYCLTGKQDAFHEARVGLEKAYESFRDAHDVSFATISSELRTVLTQFFDRSTWANVQNQGGTDINNHIWQVYLRNLAYQHSVVEFWASQLKAIRSGILNTNDGFVIQMPTSTGKTFVAELAILSSLIHNPGARCLYIAPFRALVNEVLNRLSTTLGAVGFRISNLIGGFEIDAFEEFLLNESDVLVATPEKVELLLRTKPAYFQSLSVVVIDEGHIIDEGIPALEELSGDTTVLSKIEEEESIGRGALLEFLVTRLRILLPEARFLFVSAVMPEVDAAAFSQWLSKDRREPISIPSTDRPSRQVLAKFHWRGESGWLEFVNLPSLPEGGPPFVPHFLLQQKYCTGELTPKGKLKERTWPLNTTNKAQTTGLVAAKFAATGPVLVFCAQPSHVADVTKNLITSLQYLEASDELPNDCLRFIDEPDTESYTVSKEWLGSDHLLTLALRRGVALHYGPLPDPVRNAVEEDFRRGRILVLVSTNTLGAGVNLPIKTVVIYSIERVWGGGDENRAAIKKRDFWNICGRAGRAGKETEGRIVFVCTTQRDESLLSEFKDSNNFEPVDSALFKLLQALVEGRIRQAELRGYLDSYALALMTEEVVDTEDENSIEEMLGRSLVGIQALRRNVTVRPLASAVKNAGDWVKQNVPDQEKRHVYSATGLRVDSCQILEQAAVEFLEQRGSDGNEWPLIEIDEHLLEAAYIACRKVREMKFRKEGNYVGMRDEIDLIRAWVSGESIAALRREYWPVSKAEALGEYIADQLTYKLPWGFNSFVAILSHISEFDLPLSWQHLSSCVKYGVNNVIACWISSVGVESRSIALELSKHFNPSENVEFADLVRWFVDLDDEFILKELGGSFFAKQQVIRRRNQIVPDNLHLESIRNKVTKFRSRVVGISYENRSITASQVRENDQVTLVREPTNRYDPHAIQVWHKESQIGFVQRSIARIVSPEMALERCVRSRVINIIPPSGGYPFPTIEMMIELEV